MFKTKRGEPNKLPAMKKSELPQKVCIVCKRPFTWRKKWEKVWDEVKYCSERCRRTKTKNNETN